MESVKEIRVITAETDGLLYRLEYEVISERRMLEGVFYTGYGAKICMTGPDGETEACVIPDITSDEALASELLALLIDNGVTPLCLPDIIEDYLGG